MGDYTLFQQQIMLTLCTVNMMYLIAVMPFDSEEANKVEIFNELCIMLASHFT
jgi:hypothetical protein